MCVCVLSHIQLFATPWTVAHQATLSMEFSRQEYWSRLPFSTPGNLPEPGNKATFLISPALAGRFFTTRPPGNPRVLVDSPIFIWRKGLKLVCSRPRCCVELSVWSTLTCNLQSPLPEWCDMVLICPPYAISEVWCCVQRAGIRARLSWLISQLRYVLAVWPWESYLTPLCSQLPYHRLNVKVKKKIEMCQLLWTWPGTSNAKLILAIILS